MDKYKLSKEDYEKLNKLFLTEYNIYNIYIKLAFLEALNQKESYEYKFYLDSLKHYIELEERFYNEYSSKPVKISEILYYLMEDKDNEFVENLGLVVDGNIEVLIKIRIVNRLEKIIVIDEYLSEEELSEEEFASLSIIDCEVIEALDEVINKADEEERKKFIESSIDFEIEKDILNTILRILSEYINDESYQNIRDQLIKYKYLLSLAFKEVEKDFLSNNFEIPESLFWTSKLKNDSLSLDESYYEESKNTYVEKFLTDQGNVLSNLLFEDLKDVNNYYRAITAQIIIRAISLFSNQEVISTYYSFLKDALNEQGKENATLDNIIHNSFSKVNKDRELPNIISLKL